MFNLIAPPDYEYACPYNNPVAWIIIIVLFIMYLFYRKYQINFNQKIKKSNYEDKFDYDAYWKDYDKQREEDVYDNDYLLTLLIESLIKEKQVNDLIERIIQKTDLLKESEEGIGISEYREIFTEAIESYKQTNKENISYKIRSNFSPASEEELKILVEKGLNEFTIELFNEMWKRCEVDIGYDGP